MTIAAHYAQIHATLEKARANAPLAASQTAILGASKGQPVAIIEEAMKARLVLFGENRVQEAYEKWPALKAKYPNVALHLIGPLQTNKVKDALALFDVIQTIDRPKLAEEISRSLSEASKTKHFFIQVNTGEEPQKAGVLPSDADAFIEDCIMRLKLPIVGLMCVPPENQPAAPHFAMLREMAKRHGLNELSMGMSGDYETAARMGSTCVRIGTALFAARPTSMAV